MKYVSTRSASAPCSFADVLMQGLAPDGGLFMPAEFHRVPLDASLSYEERVFAVTHPYVAPDIAAQDYRALITKSYQDFPPSPPLIPLNKNIMLLDLSQGPSFAFKDYALQLTARLFEHQLVRANKRMTILAATSGDTGAAAIKACASLRSMDVVVLHPHARIAPLQRRQMTTTGQKNVHNIGIKGSFDDCQNIVKLLFADDAFKALLCLGAVNSINWARIMAQVVYYCHAVGAAQGREVAFVVPSGNFGNIFAGYVAFKMGLSIRHLVVATNHNDVLHRFFEEGVMRPQGMRPSLSPSMDIQTASNFERLFFECAGRDHEATAHFQKKLAETGEARVPSPIFAKMKEIFLSHRVSDDETLATIKAVHETHGHLIDPHTAVGVCAAQELLRDFDGMVFCLATAHSAKFPEAVKSATDSVPPAPASLQKIKQLKEKFIVLPADKNAVKDYMKGAMIGDDA